MKIEQSARAITQPTASPVSRPTKQSESESKPVSSNTTTAPVILHKKINHWFAQAGIQTGANTTLKRDIETRVTQHRKLNAQRKIQNLEAILDQALTLSLDSTPSNDLDPDWFFRFINLAEEVYSPAMQALWGKIFAVEVSKPGSFSLKTLQTLQQLTHKDAQLFRMAVSLSCHKKSGGVPKLIVGYNQRMGVFNWFGSHRNPQINLAQYGLSYPDILILMELGLIFRSDIETGEFNQFDSSQWRYGSATFTLTARRKGIALHYYKFTAIGTELFRMVSGSTHQDYLKALLALLEKAFDVHQD